MENFNYKKKYGQNFLQDESIIDTIVDSLDANIDDLIIEIGPGSGALTKKLKKYKSYLLAFEIDLDTKKYLTPLEDKKTKIIYEDFMTANVNEHISKLKYQNIYIVGNLPYYITTPIIERIINLNLNEKSLTIMVQKEVGERLTAKPHQKEYGYMTVLLNFWYTVEQIIKVPKKVFYPIPKVDSMVIKLTRHTTPNVDYLKFIKIIKKAFKFKRKTIGNNLKDYNKNQVARILEEHNTNLMCRAEDLDIETFLDLSSQL